MLDLGTQGSGRGLGLNASPLVSVTVLPRRSIPGFDSDGAGPQFPSRAIFLLRISQGAGRTHPKLPEQKAQLVGQGFDLFGEGDFFAK